MKENKPLLEAFQQSKYQLVGHGSRDVQALNEVGEKSCYCEISIGDSYGNISKVDLRKAFKMLDDRLGEVN